MRKKIKTNAKYRNETQINMKTWNWIGKVSENKFFSSYVRFNWFVI